MTAENGSHAALTIPERGRGVAVWRQIADQLERAIGQRQYEPGEQLPTEMALAAEFGVNRHTVRRALAVLDEAGLIHVEQGRGSFVRELMVDYRLGVRTRFSRNLFDQQLAPSSELLRAAHGVADRTIATRLGIPVGAAVEVVEMLGYADGQRITLGTHFLSSKRFPGFAGRYRELNSITLAFRSFGLTDYRRAVSHVVARLPEPEEARLLRIRATRPLLVTEAVNVDLEGRPVEFCIARFVSDRVRLVVESGTTDE
ncbi:phosphonate metabolism transcriptional regulator PhnF [Oceanibacterium hippocampi]|uniref:Putative transcriptional regulator PhnF n=1 Tax=Oceanibacterium hippocampi TaxID=745714 RepID=A0A1Y5TXD0_9PROT|nr:phosphonate metabolism transcriptional regulator PhnF [Oceanibacterium hippocampi]SLN76105.1 putative transcriptional regulator PhnF [Oceanibacterium hippocampi]